MNQVRNKKCLMATQTEFLCFEMLSHFVTNQTIHIVVFYIVELFVSLSIFIHTFNLRRFISILVWHEATL